VRKNARPVRSEIDFTEDALDFKNVTLLRQYVTDQGRILRANTRACPRITSAASRRRSSARADAADEVISPPSGCREAARRFFL